MRAIEQAAIASGVTSGLEMMERAGQGVVAAVLAEWPALAAGPQSAVVLCGPGNNGGDGFVVARLLRDRGWRVEVFLYGDPARLPPDARVNYERWGEKVGDVLVDFDRRRGWHGADLAVDALFGTGLTRPLDDLTQVLSNLGDAADISADPVRRVSSAFDVPRVVAVDLPSGIDADSGKTLNPSHGGRGAASANLTVTFHAPKLGHVLAEGPVACGKLVVADIGRGREPGLPSRQARVEEASVSGAVCKASGHKYHHGHALILSGGPGRGGAARLAARGALRIGAGLVTLACPPAALIENAARLDAIMLRPLRGESEAAALAELLEDARVNALCLGPGLGIERAAALIPVALEAKRKTVLDADALTALAADPNLFAMLHGACVITPHGGEFARLFPDIADRLAAPATAGPAWSKVDATREAAARAGCTVLYKGPDTVIATPEGRAAINAAAYDRAAPWLATAGAGDVLAGFIAGLLARGFDPSAAAETAAWLHVEAARRFGPGLIAEDLPEALPGVFRDLGF
ncbi:NAD(P)H-hydrate dehydratase [Frigidibacter oleivorans]|uniref:NAD(P)H-hydrate dehydratase n=1 Tax=Frigidibacter oleivorans TaxID=2487129 RepID=UPI000F8EFCB3